MTLMLRTYTAAELRAHAAGHILMKQPDTAAMLQAGADAIEQLAQVAQRYADLAVRMEQLQMRIAVLVLELDTKA